MSDAATTSGSSDDASNHPTGETTETTAPLRFSLSFSLAGSSHPHRHHQHHHQHHHHQHHHQHRSQLRDRVSTKRELETGGGSGSDSDDKSTNDAKRPRLSLFDTHSQEDDDDDDNSDGQKQFLTTVDVLDKAERERLELEKNKKKELVIPLIHQNRWVVGHTNGLPAEPAADPTHGQIQDAAGASTADAKVKALGANSPSTTELSLEEQAVQEILSSRPGAPSSALSDGGGSGVLPIMMNNRPPGAYDPLSDEEKLRLDVAARPDDINYSAVPVEAFGEALLRGMGWTTGAAIGATNKVAVKPAEPAPRPNRLGLGATPRAVLEKDAGSLPPSLAKAKSSVQSGKSSQQSRTSTPSDGAQQQQQQQPPAPPPRRAMPVFKPGLTKRDGSNGTAPSDGEQQEVNLLSESTPFLQASSSVQLASPFPSLSAPAASTSQPATRSSSPSSASFSRGWLYPGLRVRMVSKSFQNGLYYKDKLQIVEVSGGADECTCKTQDGKVLTGIKQRMLETIVPRDKGSSVLVVLGPQQGSRALLVERNSESSRVVVKLLADQSVVTLKFDDVCELSLDT